MKRFWNEGRNSFEGAKAPSGSGSAFAQEIFAWLAGAAGLVLLIMALFYPWLGQAML